MGLDATGQSMVEGGLQVIEGGIGLISQQEGAAQVHGGGGIGGLGSGVADTFSGHRRGFLEVKGGEPAG